jgi:hypothetical protein
VNPTPHDTLARAIFGQPQHAAAELRAVLPRELLEELRLDTLVPVTASFVDDELRASCADLLFQVRWRDGESGFVYFLIEHQSTLDRRMPLRLLGYLTRIWERFAAHHPATIGLPEIVPVLIHQGPRAWPWPATFESAKAVRLMRASARAPLPLDFGFVLDDLATLSDREILARGEDAIAKLTLFALRHGREGARLTELMIRAFQALAADLRGPSVGPALAMLARYVAHVTDEPWRAVRTSLAASLPPEVRSSFMTLADQLRAEGHAKGRAAGQIEALRDCLRDLLAARFGSVDAAVQKRIERARADALRRWIREFVHATSVEALLKS